MNSTKSVTGAVTLLLVANLACAEPLPPRGVANGKAEEPQGAGFKEFLERAQDYVKLRKSMEATLPSMKSKEENPELIAAHHEALGRKIREARANGQRHGIFTPLSRKDFQQAIRSTFQGPQAASAKATVQQGAPLAPIALKVDEPYPDGVPHTTVPPTLLQKLPGLPDGLKFCMVARDLILYDMKANLVVDVLKDVLP